MSKKGWIAILAGIGVAILVTGGLVIAAGGGGGCETKGVCSEDGICASEGTCDGTGRRRHRTVRSGCGTCDEQGSVQNQGGETALSNGFHHLRRPVWHLREPGMRRQPGQRERHRHQRRDLRRLLRGSCGSGYHGGCDGTGSCDGNCVGHGGRSYPVKTGR